MGSQRFCLRWNNHQSNLLSVFDQLLHDEAFVDVTLAVEGQFLRAHKMVLSACSPYFQTLFVGHPDKHPIVILKDVPYADMRSLLDFMYRGEVSVDQDRLTAFLKVAESLRIKGLTEVNEERCDLPSIASSLLSSGPPAPPPPPHLHRIHHLPPQKRSLPPMAANPLLSSALTARKRKRGRPRKLSGSSDQPNGNGSANGNDNDQEDGLSQPNRSDSPAMLCSVLHNAPDLLEVNMGEADQSPGDPAGTGTSSATSYQGKESQQDCNSRIGDGNNTNEDVPEDWSPDSSGSQNVKPEPGMALMKNQPTPSTSMQSGASDGEKYPAGETIATDSIQLKIKTEPPPELNSNDNDNRPEDIDECYEDMIACSPASVSSGHDDHNEDDNSECEDEDGDDENDNLPSKRSILNLSLDKSDTSSLTVKQENNSDFLDEDISQYEMDSFRSMMAGYCTSSNIMNTPTQIIPRVSITSNPAINPTSGMISSVTSTDRLSRNRPIDKASVRRYCTHEADNVYRCNVCAKTYTHISNFCRHFLSAHHGVRQEIPCPVCFKLFTRKDNMMTHTKQVHRLTFLRGSGGNLTPTSAPNDSSSQEQSLLQSQLSSSTVGSNANQQHHSTSNDSS